MKHDPIEIHNLTDEEAESLIGAAQEAAKAGAPAPESSGTSEAGSGEAEPGMDNPEEVEINAMAKDLGSPESIAKTLELASPELREFLLARPVN